jgi:signal transduction histidine kinase/PAS domain-containing protein
MPQEFFQRNAPQPESLQGESRQPESPQRESPQRESPQRELQSSTSLLSGGGELGALMRAMDWSRTALGPVETWPQALRTSVRILLTSRQPMFVWWGEELINLYNDAYKSIVGGKHPQALGQPASVVWREIWDQVGPRARSAMTANEGTYDEALLLIMERHGYPEETYYTFSYSPVPSDTGEAGGILCANTDDTQRIIGARQVALLRELAARTADARTIADACSFSAQSLETNLRDLPFALIYLADSDPSQLDSGRRRIVLAGRSGIDADHLAAPAHVYLDAPRDVSLWPFAEVLHTHAPKLLTNLDALGPLPQGAWDRPPRQAVVFPIAPSPQTGRSGLLVAGLNPYRLFDDSYQGFLGLVAGQIAAAIANAQAYEEERKRVEALAELDRAKTTFFSNVSHEFRTPLTLMLGPLEELLASQSLANQDGDEFSDQRRLVAVAYRNGLRLLKLVNSLLDFARIEAGRVRANYQPTDLAAFTADLASSFRSATDKAGLRFTVNCPPLPQPAYVDRDMWEKVVLNLISNAFKFTLEGEIAVELEPAGNGSAVRLRVRDTGTGIPLEEMPRLFERFHRVEGARGRTHEGTGIGLALVQELVKLHGGSISVQSEVGRGSAFTVQIPMGSAHLPPERVGTGASAGSLAAPMAAFTAASTAMRAEAFVDEALGWLPLSGEGPESHLSFITSAAIPGAAALHNAVALDGIAKQSSRGRVLLADDNADMRAYVYRLLAPHFDVEAVADGQEALDRALNHPPDLILSDIMMPGLDGFALLKNLRTEPATSTLPVILLSARAGEESRVEGIEAGADDYLVKPFTARELLARVTTHLEMSRLRRQAAERERALRRDAEAARERATAAMEALRRANSDLEQFAFSASHDLQEPLRMVATFSQLLQMKYAGKLDEQADTIIQHCVEGATRMGRMIRDLLEYTRVASISDAQPERMALEDALEGALDNLRTAILESGAVLTHDPLPILRAEPVHLQQIFQNLVSNAIKYRGHKPPCIHIGAVRHNGGWEFTVRDNGIGIDERYQEQVFGLFKRLHSGSRYSGTGLGLAICKKLVERYHGRIWVESALGEGSTFFFTLPDSELPDGEKDAEHSEGSAY